MQTPPPDEVTLLLQAWSKGDRASLDQLMPVVYNELRNIARGYFKGERPAHTLQPTALINEAYVRLIAQNVPSWQSRTHFYGIAAQLMRQILVDHARGHHAAKRGGGDQKLSLDDATIFTRERAADLVALDDALKGLASFDQRKCRVIELRFFGGLSVEETAEVLGLSVATVGREQRLAQAWLHRELSNNP